MMIGMAEEEQKQRCDNYNNSNNNRFGSFGTMGGVNGRSSSKKLRPKPRKVPQRGLGVAQLEKIRVEEQQNNDGPAPIFPSPSPLSLPIPGFCHSNRSSSSSTFPSLPPLNLSPQTSMYGPPLPAFNMGVEGSFTIPLVDQANSGGSETGLSAVTVLEQGNGLKWQDSCEYYLGKENYGVDSGLAFRPSFDFPCEVIPAWPSPELLLRAQQNHSPPPPPMVNVSSTTSLSSGLNVQIEPPSNQSYCYGNYSTIWTDKEEKLPMVGMERLPLFNPNNPTEPFFDYNHPSFTVPNRSKDSTSPSNGSTPSFREDHTPSLPCISAPSSLENNKEDDFNGNFLTLASLANSWTSSCPSYYNVKYPPTYPLMQSLMHSNLEALPFQGGTRPPVGFIEKRPFYSFLPPAEARTGKETAISVNKVKGEAIGERVDLDLKL